MRQRVKVKVRVDQMVPFPAICVHCARPASQTMEIARRIGRARRMIDVPLCVECHRQFTRKSGEEERLLLLGRVSTAFTFLLVLALALLLIPGELSVILRLVVGLLLAVLFAAMALSLFGRASQKASLPEKQSITASAVIADYSWRATVFEFANETFAERFRHLNESLLMEN